MIHNRSAGGDSAWGCALRLWCAESQVNGLGVCWSGFAEDAVEFRAAGGADSLGHLGAFFTHVNLTSGFALVFALDAVELAGPGISHVNLRSKCELSHSTDSCRRWGEKRGTSDAARLPLAH